MDLFLDINKMHCLHSCMLHRVALHFSCLTCKYNLMGSHNFLRLTQLSMQSLMYCLKAGHSLFHSTLI